MDAVWIGVIGSVGGTLLGAILGWLLARVHIGALKVSLSSIENCTIQKRMIRKGHSTIRNPFEIYYSGSFNMHVYNESDICKTMRQPILLLCNKDGKELARIDLYDDNTFTEIDFNASMVKLGTLNIEGRTGKDYNLLFYSEKLESFIYARKLYFCYTNERSKEKKILIEDNFDIDKRLKEQSNG